MTWDIEADVDIAPEGHARLCRAPIGFFANDLSSIEVEVTRGDWPVERVVEQSFVGPADIDALTAFMAACMAPRHAVHVRLVLAGADALDYRPAPEVHLFGDALKATGIIGGGRRSCWGLATARRGWVRPRYPRVRA